MRYLMMTAIFVLVSCTAKPVSEDREMTWADYCELIQPDCKKKKRIINAHGYEDCLCLDKLK